MKIGERNSQKRWLDMQFQAGIHGQAEAFRSLPPPDSLKERFEEESEPKKDEKKDRVAKAVIKDAMARKQRDLNGRHSNQDRG